MKYASEIAHFRQLCCLGIHAQTAMPSLLRALHGLIGSNSNSFYWATKTGEISNVYMEQLMPKDILATFFREFLNNPHRKFTALDLRNYLPKGQEIGNTTKLFPTSFLNSEVYNLIWRPQSRKHMLWARVRDAQGHVNGVTLSRLVGEPAFSDRDEQRLLQLVPYLAHALNAPADVPAQMAETGDSAVVVINRHGQLEHESAEGRRLLLLAAHARIAPDAVDWSGTPFIRGLLDQLHSRMQRVSTGQPSLPPVIEIRNPWGKFVLRAYPMDSAGALAGGPVAIVIERHVPLKLKLLNAMQRLPLSARQKDVCLLVSEGATYQNLAARLGVRPNTVIDHVRKIYDKLDVRNQQELITRLSQESGATRH